MFSSRGTRSGLHSVCDLFAELCQGGKCSSCLPFSPCKNATPSLRVTVRRDVTEMALQVIGISVASLHATPSFRVTPPLGFLCITATNLHVFKAATCCVFLLCITATNLCSLYISATNLCFAERTVYTREVLAVVMQHLMEQSPLPTLLMRTVLQSLAMYPQLIGFVMNIMQRLITKQVGTDNI